MRRLFWVGVGAAAGIWAYQRGGAALERARERGLIGNVAAATATATKVAGTTARAVAAASEQGAKVAGRLASSTRTPEAPADAAGTTVGGRAATTIDRGGPS